ncbi:hypothetical protein M426DRAFT_21225 [Hypoxylon sp. CI-4A]|nr:hypothetical protein M426DRAFT_21225 [Hypoxylon sp. CI-4A]
MKVLPKGSLKLLKKLLHRKGQSKDKDTTEATATTSSTLTDDEDVSLKTSKKPSPPGPPPEECPICHDPVGIANPEGIVESWTSLHCGHKFGTHCIQTWLQESVNREPNTNPSCPICRMVARHPCGHLISPPPFTSIQLSFEVPSYVPPPRPVSPLASSRTQRSGGGIRRRGPSYHNEYHGIRRRLTRRPGHPLRPQPASLGHDEDDPYSLRRKVQTVGECKTCAENADWDKRMEARIRGRGSSSRQNTGESSSSNRSTTAKAIKSILPGALKRTKGTVRATVVHVGVEPQGLERRSVFCTAAAAPSHGLLAHRGPTPPAGYSRRLSI